ncbi:MAG: Helix-turn-helix domain [Herbinix sp.]|jgi:excisionase family DNA binding protein|nr:Helix-turn-helix domain [Herbinix sp.]
MEKEKYLTPQEVAEQLHVTPQCIRYYCNNKKLLYVTTPGGHRRIKRSDLDAFIGSDVVQAPNDIKQ